MIYKVIITGNDKLFSSAIELFKCQPITKLEENILKDHIARMLLRHGDEQSVNEIRIEKCIISIIESRKYLQKKGIELFPRTLTVTDF